MKCNDCKHHNVAVVSNGKPKFEDRCKHYCMKIRGKMNDNPYDELYEENLTLKKNQEACNFFEN